MRHQRKNQPWKATDLQSDSKTLLYEFNMLCSVASNIADGTITSNWGSTNAHVESFAVHCRNLIFFFYADDPANHAGRPRDNDILAVDYFKQESDWTAIRPTISRVLVNAKPQADRQVAHITEERRELNQPSGPTASWHITAIVRDIASVMKPFLDHAPQQNFDGNARAELLQLATSVFASVQQLPVAAPSPSASPQPMLAPPIQFQAKTDVRSTAPPPGGTFGLHGKTEP